MIKDIADAATVARLQLRKKAHQVRASKVQQLIEVNADQKTVTEKPQDSTMKKGKDLSEAMSRPTNETEAHKQSKQGTTLDTNE